MTETPKPSSSEHEMPPMAEGPLSWGFAGFFLLPLVLIALVFLTPMCGPIPDPYDPPAAETPTPETSKEN